MCVFFKIKLIIIKFSGISKLHLFSWKHQFWHISFCVCELQKRVKKQPSIGLVWFGLVCCVLLYLLTANSLAENSLSIQMMRVVRQEKPFHLLFNFAGCFSATVRAPVSFLFLCVKPFRIHLQSICAVCMLFAISICSFQPLSK